MTRQAPLLSVRDLSVAFRQGATDTLAVDRVSFDVMSGETVALVGESGSGKSVSALSVLKLLPYPAAHHPSGTILFKGHDLMGASEDEMRAVRGDEITMVFQEPMTSLNPLHTIERQVGEIVRLHRGLSERQARERTLEMLDLVGIRDAASRLDAYPHQLSGGMRQRAVIAIALALNPPLMIMDEPTTALDVVVQQEILEQIEQLKEQFGFSILFITHDLSLLIEFSDRIAIMYAGQIVEQAAAQELFEAPQHPYTRGLMSSFPALTGEKQRLTGIPGSPPDMLHPPSGCRFHPRCPQVRPMHTRVVPALRETSPGHFVACHLYDPMGSDQVRE
jgi:oligopeptide/dipeptide ABC transporter ATP-binding protein